MKEYGIIIPTTGSPLLKKSIQSVLEQSYSNIKLYVVVDGDQYKEQALEILNTFDDSRLNVYRLRENTGSDGNNGHRIYSAFSFLINSDYVLYLDQDNYYDSDHVESCVNVMEKGNIDWCYSLRKIVTNLGEYICNDDCESLGSYKPLFDYGLVDTSCYCLRRDVAIQVAPSWIGSWGHDRRLYNVLDQYFKKYSCTGRYTMNYRLGGDNNLKPTFFINGNAVVEKKYNGELPWRVL